MKTVLLTGFEPFRQHAVNPTQLIVERLNGEMISGARITGMTLPVVFGEDVPLVRSAIESIEPSLILSLGLNAGTSSIDIELFAINHRCEDGRHPLIPIVDDGPAAYFATIDVDGVVDAIIGETGLPAKRHGYAGHYLCNHIFYQTLHHFAARGGTTPVGFIHIPHATEHVDADTPSLPLDSMTDAIRAAIAAAIPEQP